MFAFLAAAFQLTLVLRTLAQMAPFEDVLSVKVNYYRALSSANPLNYNVLLAGSASTWALNCTTPYDYFANEGQIIFDIGDQDGSYPDLQKATYFAVDHWYDMRHNYIITSDQYEQLEPFHAAWEYTQMVWDSNTDLGCSWSSIECDQPEGSPAAKTVRLVCLTLPGGNKWDEWGAHVHCSDCATQSQTSTVNTATISIPSKVARVTPHFKLGAAAQASLVAHYESELHRIESYKTLKLSEFIPGYTAGVRPTKTPATYVPSTTLTVPLGMRSAPPVASNPKWQNYYVSAINGLRSQHNIKSQVVFNQTLIDQLLTVSMGDACAWPHGQEITAEAGIPGYKFAWWLADATTTDFNHEFDVALQMWEVWGEARESTGNLWKNWYGELLDGLTTTSIGCVWTPECMQTPKPSYLMLCATNGRGTIHQ